MLASHSFIFLHSFPLASSYFLIFSYSLPVNSVIRHSVSSIILFTVSLASFIFYFMLLFFLAIFLTYYIPCFFFFIALFLFSSCSNSSVLNLKTDELEQEIALFLRHSFSLISFSVYSLHAFYFIIFNACLSINSETIGCFSHSMVE